MKQLISFLIESLNKFKPTKKWMVEHYDLFNERYFNNELPSSNKIKLSVIREDGDEFGSQGMSKPYWIYTNSTEEGKYIMYKFKSDKLVSKHPDPSSLIRVRDILDLKPYIRINAIYYVTKNHAEDTLIHEMIHLYTYKDGLAPKRAHGKEFTTKCKEIREKALKEFDTKYELTTKSSISNDYEYDAQFKKQQQDLITKTNKMGGGVIGVYIRLDKNLMKSDGKLYYPERFFFCTKNLLNSLIDAVKSESTDKKYLQHIWITKNSYEKMCNEYGRFSTIRTYKFWNAEDYPKAKDFMINDAEDVINEAKKTYMKPETKLIYVPSEFNTSIFNIEDIINAQNKIEGTYKNDAKIISPK